MGALKLEPSNAQAKSGLESVNRAIEAEAEGDGAGLGGLGNMFNDPQMIQKLASNPKTAPYLADPQFMNKLQRLSKIPTSHGCPFRCGHADGNAPRGCTSRIQQTH